MKTKPMVGCWDTVVKKGITYYRFRKTVNGARVEFTARSKADLKKKVEAYENEPLNRSQKNTLKMDFKDFMKECNDYFTEIKRGRLAYSTLQERKCFIQHIQDAPLGKLQLGAVDSDAIQKYFDSRRDKGLRPKTLNKELGFVKRCLQRAVELQVLKENPADKVLYYIDEDCLNPTKEVEALEIENVKKLLTEFQRVNTKECKINGPIGSRVYGVNAEIVIFQLFSGMRIGEILGLRWKNVDLEKKAVFVKETLKSLPDEDGKLKPTCGKPKTKSSVRGVGLNEQAIQILKMQQQRHSNAKDEDLVFLSDENTPVLYRNVNKTLRAMLERCGSTQTDLSSHSLRHTYASILASGGSSIFVLSKGLGHSSIRITESTYAKALLNTDKDFYKPFEQLKIPNNTEQEDQS